MAANVYECMFLLDNTKVAGDHAAAAKQLHATLERNHAEVLASRPWKDDGRLAYPVRGQRKGLYYLTYFRTEGKNLATIEHDFSLNEMILRSLVLRIEPKYVELMLKVARDEHAVALQTVNEPPSDEEGLEGPRGDLGEHEHGPRRGGRRPVEMKD
jgi:small subunit ribosomal protein S6